MSVARKVVAAAAAWPVLHQRNAGAAPRATILPKSMPLQLADHQRALARITRWPEYQVTPLHECSELAAALGIGALYIKDETGRLGIGSFKGLGGAFAVEELLDHRLKSASTSAPSITTASAGNHGIGLAWACHRLSVPCHVFLSQSVAESQAMRIRGHGGTVHRVDGGYEASLAAARRAADEHGWLLVQDVDWAGYEAVPRDIFAGYTVLAGEICEQLDAPLTHVIVNAGVGGLASAVCAHFWARYGAARPRFVSAEPRAADCLLHSARLGRCAELPAARVAAESTRQTGLDCKVPAPLAWRVLARGLDDCVAVPDDVIAPCVRLLADPDALAPPIRAGESAVAGLGALVASAAQPDLARALCLGPDSRVAIIVCEAALDRTAAGAGAR